MKRGVDRFREAWRKRGPSAPGEAKPWLVSLAVHFLFLISLGLFTHKVISPAPALILTSLPPELPPDDELRPAEFRFDPRPADVVGQRAMGGLEPIEGPSMAREPMELPALELEVADAGMVEARELVSVATEQYGDLQQSVRGMAGVGVTGAEGAIDRLTQEILLSLEERPTLVAWFFDRSASLQTQRVEVLRRFRQIYNELGEIQSTGANAFARHADRPLLTSIIAFGSDVQWMLDEPTDNLEEIERAIEAIRQDDSGIEQVFTALHSAAVRLRKYRTSLGRNVMFVAFTDEAGDDQDHLDSTVTLCRRLAIPVYVVGVPAPFGRRETLVKWVDPDPRYDQTPQWGRVDQGPETLMLERVQLMMSGFREEEAPIDSGFGPFALTRLCYETGGIYFAVHPNRDIKRRVGREETAAYAAYFSAFFDPVRMRRYRPEYVSAKQYMHALETNAMRRALVEAAQMSALRPLESPRRRFVVRTEAQFASELTEAQKDAARVQPALEQLTQILSSGQQARDKEIVPRWQAGYDLAMGRVSAAMVRAQGYNAMLAQAKRGLAFANQPNNTWVLNPSDEVTGGNRIEQEAELARMYLGRVLREHEGTPWALLAQRELEVPLGWKWDETFTQIDPPADRSVVNNPRDMAPRDERPQMLAPPPPRRQPPKL